jgi:phosphatidylglycerophosphate synthase
LLEDERPEVLKEHDSPVAVFFAGRIALALLPVAQALRLSPMGVTTASLATTLVAAALIAIGDSSGSAVIAAALILAGFIFDCLDGQLARVTGAASDLGAYADSMTDMVKVFALLAACGSKAPPLGAPLAGWAFLFFVLCQHHAQITRRFPQRSEDSYREVAAPWKRRLRFGGQTIDVAFAIGEVLFALAVATALRRPLAALVVLAVVLPLQYASYAVRFWKHRYAG